MYYSNADFTKLTSLACSFRNRPGYYAQISLSFFFYLIHFIEGLFYYYYFLMATPVTYGSSQVRGQIRTAAGALATAMAMQDPSHICDLLCSSWQRLILNPGRPGIEPASSQTLWWVLNPLSHNRNSNLLSFYAKTMQSAFVYITYIISVGPYNNYRK